MDMVIGGNINFFWQNQSIIFIFVGHQGCKFVLLSSKENVKKMCQILLENGNAGCK